MVRPLPARSPRCAIELAALFVLGFTGKKLIDGWMARKGATPNDVREQAGPARGKHTRFLLGVWYRED